MAYKRRKPALYEVISRSSPKPASGGPVEPLHGNGAERSDERQKDDEMPSEPLEWPKKRRLVWFSNNKVEISVANSLAIAVVLGVILLILFAFRLGQLAGAK